jgi:adenosylcobinamide-GDP ribazoletransferase
VVSALITGPRFPVEAIAGGALARAAAIALPAIVPYAGGPAGAGAWTRGVGFGRGLAAITVAGVIGVLAIGPAVGAMAVACVAVVVGLGRWSRRRLGGATGDTLGATVEASEALALAAALAVR